MDAEQLALAGEQLISPYTFHLADKSFEMALAKDPENKRAQLYRALLKPLMKTKGLIARVRPLVRGSGDAKQFEQGVKDLPNAPIKEFLTTGTEDIKNADQALEAVIDIRNAFIDTYEFLKKNQDLNMIVHLNPHVFERAILQAKHDSCRIIEPSSPHRGENENLDRTFDAPSYGFEVECDYTEIATRKLNPADMIAMRQMVASYVLYLTMFSAYNVTGVEEVFKEDEAAQQRNGGVGLNTQQVIERLDKLPAFGSLRKDHTLGLMKSLGADFAAAWKWAMKNQNHLCPATKYPTDRKRRGYVFDNGICTPFGTQAEQKLALLEKALEGMVNVKIRLRPEREREEINVDMLAFSRAPVSSLKEIFPTSFTTCEGKPGTPTNLKDPTVAGIFPSGDVNRMFRCPK